MTPDLAGQLGPASGGAVDAGSNLVLDSRLPDSTTDAKLDDAKLDDAQLDDAQLSDAQLSDAQLNDAQLSDAKGSTSPKVSGVVFKTCGVVGRAIPIEVSATDPAGGQLTVSWAANAGLVTGGLKAQFLPATGNAHPCPYVLTYKVTSSVSGQTTQGSIAIHIGAPGDVNADGSVNGFDIGAFTRESGRIDCCDPAAPACRADLDGDCDVDSADASALASIITGPQKTGCACPHTVVHRIDVDRCIAPTNKGLLQIDASAGGFKWSSSKGMVTGGASASLTPQSGDHLQGAPAGGNPCPYQVTSSGPGYPATLQTVATTLLGDLNADGAVNGFDINAFQRDSGRTDCCARGVGTPPCLADLNGDCVVDKADASLLTSLLLSGGRSGGCPCSVRVHSARANACVSPGQQSNLRVLASDALVSHQPTYKWSASAGAVTGSANGWAKLTPPAPPASCQVVVTATVRSSVNSREEVVSLKVVRKMAGDVNGDGAVDSVDTSLVTAALGQTGCCSLTGFCAADLDGDCSVTAADVALVTQEQGKTGGCVCP